MVGKKILDLAPRPENNRNSEGAFIELKDGRLLFVFSRYNEKGASDGAEADLYGMISSDQGETFCAPYLVLNHKDYEASNIMSVSLMRMQNGDLGLFFLVKRQAGFCVPHLVRSADEGQTWSAPVRCIADDGYFVLNNDRVIRTASGRILMPLALHDSETYFDPNLSVEKVKIQRGCLVTVASDDDGYTWKVLGEKVRIPFSRGSKTGVQEPGFLELENGHIWCYIRTDVGRQYECFSADSGESWSMPLPSWFTSAISPLSVKRLSTGELLAVWNPVPVYNGRTQRPRDNKWTGARTPLAYALSSDNGETFCEPVAIEDDELSGFCYVAIHETADQAVLLAYCSGSVDDGSTLNRLRIRKISLQSLRENP